MLTLVEETDTLAIVALSGRLDSLAARELQPELESLVHSGRRFLVLDFAAVTLLASSGLRLLIILHAACQRTEGAMVLAAVPKPVTVVLELSGFAPHFKCYPDAADARAALAG